MVCGGWRGGGDSHGEGNGHRDAGLRCGLAQLPVRQADDRLRHRRLERVRGGVRLTRRRHRDRPARAARHRPAGGRARAHLRRPPLRHTARVRERDRPGRSAPSRTPCSMPRPRRWVCPATSSWAARCATGSESTGRTAPPGASRTRPGTSRPSPISTASWRSRARRGRKASARSRPTSSSTSRPAGTPRAGVPASARRSSPSSTSNAPSCATSACIWRRCARAAGRTWTCCSTSTSMPRPRAT